MTIYVNKLKRFHQPTKAAITALITAIVSDEKWAVQEISLTYVDNAQIRQLNQQYLHKDRPTDVIAFTLSEPGQPLMADIYISVEQAAIQAKDYAVRLKNELIRLTAHGVLHTLGYDHETAADAELMKTKENMWVAKFDPQP